MSLRDVPLTPNHVVGGPGLGLERLYSFLAFDRLLYGVAVAGLARAGILERALQPRSRPTRVRRSLGGTRVHSGQTGGHEAYHGVGALAYTPMLPRVCSVAGKIAAATELASMSKLTASEGMVRAGLEFIQVFGHAGYERANGIERVLRDAVALRLAGGTTEMQKKNVFKGLCLSGAGNRCPLHRHDHQHPSFRTTEQE